MTKGALLIRASCPLVTHWYLKPDSFIWQTSLPCPALACPEQPTLQEQVMCSGLSQHTVRSVRCWRGCWFFVGFFKDYISTSFLQHEPRQFLKTGVSLLYLLPLRIQSNQDSDAKRDEWAEESRWNSTLAQQEKRGFWKVANWSLASEALSGAALCAPFLSPIYCTDIQNDPCTLQKIWKTEKCAHTYLYTCTHTHTQSISPSS